MINFIKDRFLGSSTANFITVPDAMQEYDIGEEQLFEVIESGMAAPYDSTRAKLGAEGFEELIAANVEAETSRAERYFSRRAPQPDIWSRNYQRDVEILARLQARFDESCREIEARVPLQVLHSLCFIRDELESALRDVCPAFFQNYLASKQLISTGEPAPVPARTKEKSTKARNTSGSTTDNKRRDATRRAFKAVVERIGEEVTREQTKERLGGLIRAEIGDHSLFHKGEFESSWDVHPWTNSNPGRRRG